MRRYLPAEADLHGLIITGDEPAFRRGAPVVRHFGLPAVHNLLPEHVVYYVGLGDLYSNYLAKNAIVSDKMNTWQEGLTGSLTATTQFSIRFASVG